MSLSGLLPGEEVLTNRVRMTFPADTRSEELPETDEALCCLIRSEMGVSRLTYRCVKQWVRTHLFQCFKHWDAWHSNFARERFGYLFSDEVCR